MKVLPAIQLLGFVLGAAATGLLSEVWQQGALVGVLTAACAEWWSLRRRLSALDPQASQAAFTAALAGGFLTKLMLLVGLTLVAEFWNLFSAQAFLIAFVVTVLWGEVFAVLLLLRSRPSRVSSEDPSTRS
jgi:hypothetical protein